MTIPAVSVSQETFEIHIIEPAIAPRLYLQTDNVLDSPTVPTTHSHARHDNTFTALHTGRTSLGLESNATHKDVGTIHLCDVNRNDELELLWLNLDDNVTYTIAEVTGASVLDTGAAVRVNDEEEDDMVTMCLQTNIRLINNK